MAALARLTPGPVASAMTELASPLVALADPTRRRTVERHLRRACPDLSGWRLAWAARAAFASYARYWVESFRLPTLAPEDVDRGMVVDGFEHIEDAVREGRGVILALPHMGGWEWAGAWMGVRGYPVTVVVEAVEPPALFQWFVELRSRMGMTVVALGPHAASRVLAVVRAAGVACLLCDRDIGGGGISVELFGEKTRLPAGPATLALRAGAALCPTAVYFDATVGHRGVVRPPVDCRRRGTLREDVARITQELAHEFEDLIRAAPQQWHMFQPNWPSDPGYKG